MRTERILSTAERRFPRKSTCLEIYSRRVNGTEDLPTVLKRYFPWCLMWGEELRGLFKAYAERKQQQHVLDYDDLLLYWFFLVEEEGLAETLSNRFDHILVDEYQDTNRLQAGILRGMRRTNPNITVVGDDAQSIYSFRGADVRNMLDFSEEFPGARVMFSEQNYRSTAAILETANRLIAEAKGQYPKMLWSSKTGGRRPQLVTCEDEDAQSAVVIRNVLEHYEQGVPMRQQAVLFRAAWHSNALEVELNRRKIPYRKYEGLKFLEAAHVKDLVCLLRLLENPRDEVAWFRVLQLLPGVGPATPARVVKALSMSGYSTDALSTFPAPPPAQADLGNLADVLNELQGRRDLPVAAQMERVLAFYGPLMERAYDNYEPRRQDLLQLQRMAGTDFSQQSRAGPARLDERPLRRPRFG